MDQKIANVLAELRQDHKNMGMMLNLLEREASRLYDGDDPDFNLLHDIMHYMTVYPDAVHHPKEDRIYAELKAVRPDLSSGFRRITVEHRQIAEQGIKLRDAIAMAHSDQFVRRKTIVTDALRYVNTLRGHMQWEELDLFRRVEKMVSDGHDLVETATYLRGNDPVFGSQVGQQFENLVKSIRNSICDD